jgi:CDGSH-type Zn-finger protein
MARLVTKTAHGNLEIKTADGKSVYICQCGLSKNQPFCDSSHKKTLDEDDSKMYIYNEDGTREEMEMESEEGCCGGSCCGKCHEE